MKIKNLKEKLMLLLSRIPFVKFNIGKYETTRDKKIN